MTGLELAGIVSLGAIYVCWCVLYLLSVTDHNRVLFTFAFPGLIVFLGVLIVYALASPRFDNNEVFENLKRSANQTSEVMSRW